MSRAAVSVSHEFASVFRRWRRQRKLSQLELALAAGVSQRHVSWLETGRSQPSREMVVRLAEAMDVPLRERNVLLQSAGYAALYRERQLDEPGMEPVLRAVRYVLDHHDPYPAAAVDRFWNVRMHNRAARLLLGDDPAAWMERMGETGELNLALLSLHPGGLRPFITNWDEIAPSFVRRLRSEAWASGDDAMRERFERFISLAGPLPETDEPHASLMPVLPLELEVAGRALSLFTVITTLGTPQDVTADELRVEAFFPADATTEAFFREAAG